MSAERDAMVADRERRMLAYQLRSKDPTGMPTTPPPQPLGTTPAPAPSAGPAQQPAAASSAPAVAPTPGPVTQSSPPTSLPPSAGPATGAAPGATSGGVSPPPPGVAAGAPPAMGGVEQRWGKAPIPPDSLMAQMSSVPPSGNPRLDGMGGDFTRELGMRDAAQFGSMGSSGYDPWAASRAMSQMPSREPPPSPSEELRGQIGRAWDASEGRVRGRGRGLAKPMPVTPGLPGEK